MLTSIAQELIECEALNINLVGYTDNVGSPRHNKVLSERRVNSVMDVLLQMDIDRKRIGALGTGETLPVAPNDSVEGRQLNRRVRITLD